MLRQRYRKGKAAVKASEFSIRKDVGEVFTIF